VGSNVSDAIGNPTRKRVKNSRPSGRKETHKLANKNREIAFP